MDLPEIDSYVAEIPLVALSLAVFFVLPGVTGRSVQVSADGFADKLTIKEKSSASLRS